jgi:hypothetical protein
MVLIDAGRHSFERGSLHSRVPLRNARQGREYIELRFEGVQRSPQLLGLAARPKICRCGLVLDHEVLGSEQRGIKRG